MARINREEKLLFNCQIKKYRILVIVNCTLINASLFTFANDHESILWTCVIFMLGTPWSLGNTFGMKSAKKITRWGNRHSKNGRNLEFQDWEGYWQMIYQL